MRNVWNFSYSSIARSITQKTRTFEVKKSLFCKIGLHWPVHGHKHDFVDNVSGKIVFLVVCPCGKSWLIDSLTRFPFFKVESKRKIGGAEANVV